MFENSCQSWQTTLGIVYTVLFRFAEIIFVPLYLRVGTVSKLHCFQSLFFPLLHLFIARYIFVFCRLPESHLQEEASLVMAEEARPSSTGVAVFLGVI